jgi:DMSO/TMAO reductase YedYZ heme-binding membrane subunit
MIPLAAAGPSAYWYLARGTGAVALLLLTASVVIGVGGSQRAALASRWPRFAIDLLHRHISLLVLALLAVHVLTSALDGFAPIALADAVVPFQTPYRPLWMALGALSFDLLIALAATSLLRRRFGYSAWRAVHWLAYVSWPIAALHGLGAGSDTRQSWMLALTAACVAAVLAAVLVRLARAGGSGSGDSRARSLRAALLATTLLTPAGIAVFAYAGPLQHGWARRAGTPARLLGATVVPVAAAGSRRPVPTTPAGSFSARLSGRAVQRSVPGGVVIDLSLLMDGSVPGRLRVRLAGAPLNTGGLSLTGSQVDLGAPALGAVMQGNVVSLQGPRFLARVSDRAGTVLDLNANLNIDSQTGRVSGTLDASPGGAP